LLRGSLIQFLIDKYTLKPPALRKDEIHIESEGDAQIDVNRRFDFGFIDDLGPRLVPGAYVKIAIPFDGDADLFTFRGSSFTTAPPIAQVFGDTLLITYQDVKLDPQQTRLQLDRTIAEIERYLGWIRNDCDTWNARIPTIARQRVQDRKRRLLEQANMVSALGLPMKRRSDASSTFIVTVPRKQRPVTLPPAPKETFRPEPTISENEYNYILREPLSKLSSWRQSVLAFSAAIIFSAIRFWRVGARPVRGWIALVLLHRSLFGHIYPVASILRRAIHMLASANSMCSCAVFLAKPR
jgi:hypothetical protein